jgi:FXSXX-COOH protein
MSPTAESNERSVPAGDPAMGLAELRDTHDTALAAAIARVSDEAAEPTAVAAAWSSAT